jgi:hypothetical protein
MIDMELWNAAQADKLPMQAASLHGVAIDPWGAAGATGTRTGLATSSPARTHAVWQLAAETPGTRCRRSFDARGVITITWAPRPRRAGSQASPVGAAGGARAVLCMPARQVGVGLGRSPFLPPAFPVTHDHDDIDPSMLARGTTQGPGLCSCASAFGAGDRRSTSR